MSNHIVELRAPEVSKLRQWLERPNGAHIASPRLTVEAVEGGGLLVRTSSYGKETLTHKQTLLLEKVMLTYIAAIDMQGDRGAYEDAQETLHTLRNS